MKKKNKQNLTLDKVWQLDAIAKLGRVKDRRVIRRLLTASTGIDSIDTRPMINGNKNVERERYSVKRK